MFRTRLPHVVGLISATLLLSFLPAQSATIAGTNCTKLNSTKTVANIKYTCIKSGKKLVWNKGVALKPVPKPSPKVSKSSESVQSQSESAQEKVILLKPSSGLFYGNLYSDMDKLLVANTPDTRINYFISENSKLRATQKYVESLNIAVRLFYPYFNKNEINVVFFTEADAKWIDQKQTELMGTWLINPLDQLQSYRLARFGCNIGGMYLPNNFVICTKNDTDRSAIYSSSFVSAHEYTHIAIMTSQQLTNSSIGDSRRLAPCWVHEGFAQFVGMFAASHIDPQFKEDRNQFFTNIQSTVNRTSRESVISTYIDLEKSNESGGEYCSKIQDAYFLGSIAFEKLAKDFGFEQVMESYRLFLSGLDWKAAFKKTYGYTTLDFYEKMADIVTTEKWVA